MTDSTSSDTTDYLASRFWVYSITASGATSTPLYCSPASTYHSASLSPNSAIWCQYYLDTVDRSCHGTALMALTTSDNGNSVYSVWITDDVCDNGCERTTVWEGFPVGTEGPLGYFYGCSDGGWGTQLYRRVTGTGTEPTGDASWSVMTATGTSTAGSNTLSTFSATSESSLASNSSSPLPTGAIIGIVIAAVVALLSFALFIFLLLRHRKQKLALQIASLSSGPSSSAGNSNSARHHIFGPHPGIQEMAGDGRIPGEVDGREIWRQAKLGGESRVELSEEENVVEGVVYKEGIYVEMPGSMPEKRK